MNVAEHISLKPYNTFGIDAKAKYFTSFNTVEALQQLLEQYSKEALMVLGGGSNILLTKDFDGLVLKNDVSGIELISETDEHVFVKVGAGVNWHQFVLYTIANNWAGLENLSLIPGNCGASPMQNIGAYGVEIKDVFYQLEAYHLAEKKIINFTADDCAFAYRESVFKNKYKDQFVILSVSYKLDKHPTFHTSYGAIEQELAAMNIPELSIQAISKAVINIRSSKLPDPAKIGNAGSFFKNPEISNEQFELLKKEHTGIVGYALPNGHVKLAAGWLIENAGWKGYRKGDAGVHDKQALVLVNFGNANGNEIYDLSTSIIDSIQQKFGVMLEREVNII